MCDSIPVANGTDIKIKMRIVPDFEERRSLTLVSLLVGGVIGNEPMTYTAEWKSAGKSRLPELLAVFGCADVIAPVDEEACRKAGALISHKRARRKPETVAPPTGGKYRLRALQCEEVAAQTRDPYAKQVLTELAREFMQAAHQTERGKDGHARV